MLTLSYIIIGLVVLFYAVAFLSSFAQNKRLQKFLIIVGLFTMVSIVVFLLILLNEILC